MNIPSIAGPKRPNFFFVGAPKCGTSTMWRVLSSHPSVFMCTAKEPHYFNTDLVDPVVMRDWTPEEYLGLFSAVTDEIVIGEASVFYLFSEVAVQKIRDFAPEAKLLVMVRNPLELVPSFHSQLLYSGQEKHKDLARAWAAQNERSGSRLLRYGEVAKLGEQLRRTLEVFPRDQVHVVIFDDLRADSVAEYHRTLDFLGLPHDDREALPVVNPNRGFRSLGLQRIMEMIPEPKALKQVLGIERLGLFDRIKARNRRRFQRPALPESLLDEMRDYFASDVELLSEITERDLSHWLAKPPARPSP